MKIKTIRILLLLALPVHSAMGAKPDSIEAETDDQLINEVSFDQNVKQVLEKSARIFSGLHMAALREFEAAKRSTLAEVQKLVEPFRAAIQKLLDQHAQHRRSIERILAQRKSDAGRRSPRQQQVIRRELATLADEEDALQYLIDDIRKTREAAEEKERDTMRTQITKFKKNPAALGPDQLKVIEGYLKSYLTQTSERKELEKLKQSIESIYEYVDDWTGTTKYWKRKLTN